MGLMTTLYSLRFETPPTWKARSPYYIPQDQGGPVISPALRSLFVPYYDSRGYGGDIGLLRHRKSFALYGFGAAPTENTVS
jgi:hypothetical protein